MIALAGERDTSTALLPAPTCDRGTLKGPDYLEYGQTWSCIDTLDADGVHWDMCCGSD